MMGKPVISNLKHDSDPNICYSSNKNYAVNQIIKEDVKARCPVSMHSND